MLSKPQAQKLAATVSEALALAGKGIPTEEQRRIRLYVTSQLVERDITSTSDLNPGEYRDLIDQAYPGFWDGNEALSNEFVQTVRGIAQGRFKINYG